MNITRNLSAWLLSGLLFAVGCGEKGQNPAEPIIAQSEAEERFSNGMLSMIEQEVALSESQKTALKKISDELANEVASKRATFKAEMAAFANAFKSETLADADLDAIVPQLPPKEKHRLMQQKLIEAHAVLTPEQRNQIADKLTARQNEMKDKRAKWAEKHSEKLNDGDFKKHKRDMIMGGFMLKKLARELDLTESQKAGLAQIGASMQAKLGDVKKDVVKPNMEAFIAEFRKEKIDETVLTMGADELAQKHEQMRAAMKASIKELHALLSPEQRAKAAEKLTQFAERAPMMHGKRGHHGKPHFDFE